MDKYNQCFVIMGVNTAIGSFSKMMLQFVFFLISPFSGRVCVTEQMQQRYYVIL